MNKPNILVVIFDTLRYDYFQKFLSKDPILSKVLKDFTSYDRAYAPSSWTLPSHFSLFTGLYPSEHGVHADGNSNIDKILLKAKTFDGKFLTDVASSVGYHTFGISANPWISYLSNFESKFTKFYNVDPLGMLRSPKWILNSNEIDELTKKSIVGKLKFIVDKRILKAVILYEIQMFKLRNSILNSFPLNKGYTEIFSLLDKLNFKEPYFCFLNFMEMHEPYFKGLNLRGDHDIDATRNLFDHHSIGKKRIEHLKNAYFKQILKVKTIILNLLEFLKNKNLYDETLIVFTSDHGQALMEKDYYGHGIYLYDELIHIPLLIKPQSGVTLDKRKEAYVNLVDLHDFLSGAMKGEDEISKYLKKDVSFSEEFGMQTSRLFLEKYIHSERDQNVYQNVNLARKTVLRDDCKLTLNSNSEIEELYSNYKKEVNMNQINKLLFELKIFNVDNNFVIRDNINETPRGDC